MFKVLCIDDKPRILPFKVLTENKVYTVIGNVKDMYGEVGYLLLEVKHPIPEIGFLPRRFIPISNIDETELIKERQSSTLKEIQ